jgi:transcription elongation factor Elf1
MPASLLEAFSSPSIGGTESLHNPRYELDLDHGKYKKPPESFGNIGSTMVYPNTQEASSFAPSGRQRQQQIQLPQQQTLFPQQQLLLSQGNGAQRDTISLDNDTKCDLHLYHILSCQSCRQKLKTLLNSNETKPNTSQIDVYNQKVDKLIQGILGMNINQKIQNAISNTTSVGTSPATSSGGWLYENLFLVIIICFFLLYALDMVLRRYRPL